MKNKITSLIIIAIIYLIVAAIGTIIYLNLEMDNPIYKLLIVDIIMTVIIWLLSLGFKNASLYDPYWSVIPPVLMFIFMVDYNLFGPLNILLFGAILVWAIRLTLNWAKLWKDFTHFDWRYQNIKDSAPSLYFLTSLIGIMLFPTIIVFIQLTGILNVLAVNKELNALSVIGCIVIVLAATIQYVADKQMQRFKGVIKNKGKVNQEGLWKYSRHPNYLGEILVWVGAYLVYLANFGIDYMILAPLVMTLMFVFVSIPMLEKRQLKSKPSYEDYIAQTSVLLPLKVFKKSK